MAVYSVTAAEVLPQANCLRKEVIVGATGFSAGASLYKKPSDGRYYPAQADGNADEVKFEGIALSTPDIIGAPILMAYDGDIQLDTAALTGAALGDLVVLGTVAGGLYPSGDLATTNRVTLCGYIKQVSPTIMRIFPVLTGVAKP